MRAPAARGRLRVRPRSGRDKIPKGVTVGGVDVGGLTKAQAERKLEREYLAALHEPIVVHHGDEDLRRWARARPGRPPTSTRWSTRRWPAAREGNMFTRTFRGLTGGKLDERRSRRR